LRRPCGRQSSGNPASVIASRIQPLKPSTVNGLPHSVVKMQTCLRGSALRAVQSDCAFSTRTVLPGQRGKKNPRARRQGFLIRGPIGASARLASVAGPGRRRAVTLKTEVDCDRRRRPYRRAMNAHVKTAYDVYCLKADPTLRIAVAAGARLPVQFKVAAWKAMARGTSPLHSEASKDIGVTGYCYFQVTKGG
jgi:hypothetical protein